MVLIRLHLNTIDVIHVFFWSHHRTSRHTLQLLCKKGAICFDDVFVHSPDFDGYRAPKMKH